MSDPQTLAMQYLRAIEAHDYDTARALLSDGDFVYKSPISRFSDADAFIAHMSLSGSIVQRVEVRHAFVDGPDVCHFLVFHVQLSEKMAVDLVQWVHVQGGRIDRIEALFDAHPYRLLFEP
ncbi:nuclear transport factor 2 family protein [Ectothiorhodospira sp. BSL-9]|uniref:nuclear transport factor 2 family protein n=1 Tax=Ectothiorhodospira sp. BSL-9 TaxID=1442136 RepID=UPI0007B44F42|nr:nuclear transport factor 2 family protein [Ectothiorhodospira sp. BSL-9]ANB01238.1 hypothetical protein ECTOBSL9_0304 [Ectothiorhodospira sp. BSL-9]TVQ72591.1 MAG: nuclear transport factor 2 family protein [Chromatiaceae bacterium]